MNAGNSILGSRYDVLGHSHEPFLDDIRGESREKVLKLLDKSETESLPCLCGEVPDEENEVLAGIDKRGLPVRNVICKSCGLVRIQPRYISSV